MRGVVPILWHRPFEYWIWPKCSIMGRCTEQEKEEILRLFRELEDNRISVIQEITKLPRGRIDKVINDRYDPKKNHPL